MKHVLRLRSREDGVDLGGADLDEIRTQRLE